MKRVNLRKFYASLDRVPLDQQDALRKERAFYEEGTDAWSKHVVIENQEAIDAAIAAASLSGANPMNEAFEDLARRFAGRVQ